MDKGNPHRSSCSGATPSFGPAPSFSPQPLLPTTPLARPNPYSSGPFSPLAPNPDAPWCPGSLPGVAVWGLRKQFSSVGTAGQGPRAGLWEQAGRGGAAPASPGPAQRGGRETQEGWTIVGGGRRGGDGPQAASLSLDHPPPHVGGRGAGVSLECRYPGQGWPLRGRAVPEALRGSEPVSVSTAQLPSPRLAFPRNPTPYAPGHTPTL